MSAFPPPLPPPNPLPPDPEPPSGGPVAADPKSNFLSIDGEHPTPYYTITLQNARIASVRNWKPNTRDLSADRAGDLEEVSFVYQRITWTFNDGGVEWEDDWESPNA